MAPAATSVELATATVGVIGVGVVGGAVRSYFEPERRAVLCYDKFKDLGSIAELNQADVVFICVPTPYVSRHGLDASAVEEAVASLTGEKIVVLKSTVPPGTTQALAERYPQHTFFFNPEFLRENRAMQDFLQPDRQLVGYTKLTDQGLAAELIRLLPSAPYEAILSATSAELTKLLTNSMLALRVVFANEVFDLASSLGLDYEEVRNGLAADPRIGGSHLNVFDGGYRGYGGKCLPKDVGGVLDFAHARGVPMHLLEAAHQVNKVLLQSSSLAPQ